MARILMSTQGWGVLQDANGNVKAAESVTVKNRDGTNATHYSARTGGSSSTSAITSSSTGSLDRWIETGPYTLTVGASTYDVEAVSGDDVKVIKEAPLNPKHSPHSAVFDGTTTDTTAVQSALDALNGGEMLWPGKAKVGALTLPAKGAIRGLGWSHSTNAAFGNSGYTNASNFGGSALISTVTSGNAIATADAVTHKFDITDLLVIGPGSGTSKGVKLGTSAASGKGLVQAKIKNVLVVNFATGWDIDFAQDNTFMGIRTRGCSTGISVDDESNQNEFYNTEIQYSSVDGIVVGAGAVCAVNLFRGGLLQNISGTAAIRTVLGTENQFDAFWFEGVTATHTVDFTSSGTAHRLTNAHYSSNVTDLVRTGSNYSRIGPLYSVDSSKAVTILADTGRVVLDHAGEGSITGTLVDNGASQTTRVGFATERIAAWLADDAQGPITVGYLPKNSLVLRVGVYVNEAFNSSGTDIVWIGGTGAGDRYAGNTDVSTTGPKTPGAGSGGTLPFTMAGGDTITAQYFNGGTEPTTGKALVWVEYATVPAVPA